MSKYLLVQFSDGTGLVPRIWVEHQDEDELVVAFPPKKEYKFLRKYVNESVPPSEQWSSFQAKMILESDDLAFLRRKSDLYDKKGSFSTTDVEMGRKRPDPTVYIEDQKNKRIILSDDNVCDSIDNLGSCSPSPARDHLNRGAALSSSPSRDRVNRGAALSSSPSRDRVNRGATVSSSPSRSLSYGEALVSSPLSQPSSIIATSLSQSSQDCVSDYSADACTENLNFSHKNISRTRRAIEKKMGCSLNSREGLVNLLISQQLLLMRNTNTIKELRDEIKDLKKASHRFDTRLNDNDENDALDTIREYEDFVLKLVDKPFFNEMANRLTFFSGDDPKDTVSRMVRRLLTPKMQVDVNFSGIGMVQKASKELEGNLRLSNYGFKECLLPLVIKAVQSLHRSCTPGTIHRLVQQYLRGATDRNGGRARRQKRRDSSPPPNSPTVS